MISESLKAESFLLPHSHASSDLADGPSLITRGKGIYVYDHLDKEYIEGVSGLWCASLGFSEDRLISAATHQLAKLPFYGSFNNRTHEVAISLSEKLMEIAPIKMSKIFFANSGSEANDTAIKLIWYYHNCIGQPQKKKIIAYDRAYHGVTIGAGSLTGLSYIHHNFDLPKLDVIRVPSPYFYRNALPNEDEKAFCNRHAKELEEKILEDGPDTIAAFIAEPVLGAGGVIVPPKNYYKEIQKVLNKYNILLIADEIVTGFARTGKMFGTETFELTPDIITVAKGLSSAYLPISAVYISERIIHSFKQTDLDTFAHGFTYSAHPVCSAVALETLTIYQERNILQNVQSVSEILLSGLNRFVNHPLVGDIRGIGLVAGVELVQNKELKKSFPKSVQAGQILIKRAYQHGLILRAMGDTIVFSPPLIINSEELHSLLDRFEKALNESLDLLRPYISK